MVAKDRHNLGQLHGLLLAVAEAVNSLVAIVASAVVHFEGNS
jgi:hypothetical protein